MRNTHCIQKTWIKNFHGNVPYVTASSENNAVDSYVEYDRSTIDKGNAIVIGGKTFVVTYQKDDFFSNDSHNLVLRLKGAEGSERIYLFLTTVIARGLGPKYSWGDSVSYKKIQNDKVTLPVRENGEIDFGYMEAFIRELESARIRELEAYLAAAGFDDCELTQDERLAVERWQEGGVAVREFRIAELFSVDTPKRRFNANAVKFGGTHPYVVRTSQGNGQRGTIVADEVWLNPGNTISFGQDTATIFYQPEAYFTGDKIKVMTPLFGAFDERIACYCLATMRKAFSMFGWGRSSFNEKVLKDVAVQLPVTDSGEVDFAFMETFVRGMMKRAIRGVVEWKDREIAATRDAI